MKEKERNYEPITKTGWEERGFVKSEGFEKVIVLLMTITEQIWRMMQKHKSFRMELDYDAEALNTNYFFYTANDKSEPDDMNQES
jgi:hypothetical protein